MPLKLPWRQETTDQKAIYEMIVVRKCSVLLQWKCQRVIGMRDPIVDFISKWDVTFFSV